MKEKSTEFVYQDAAYELVKVTYSDVSDWRVYRQTLEGRGEMVTSFTDVKFNEKQATHVAMHKLSAFALGLQAGKAHKQRFGATG